jgi:DNA-binding MarR family transcriptional regulator
VSTPAGPHEAILAALVAMMRGIDHVHSSGLLIDRSGVRLERALHPVLTTIGERGPLRTTELATALALSSSTVSRHVARLEALGLVDRAGDPHDARATRIELSATGRDAHRALRQAWESIMTERLAVAGLDHPEAFASDLGRIGAALESAPR